MTTDIFDRAAEHLREYAKEYVFYMNIEKNYISANRVYAKSNAVIQLFTSDQFWELLTLFNDTIALERKAENV